MLPLSPVDSGLPEIDGETGLGGEGPRRGAGRRVGFRKGINLRAEPIDH